MSTANIREDRVVEIYDIPLDTKEITLTSKRTECSQCGFVEIVFIPQTFVVRRVPCPACDSSKVSMQIGAIKGTLVVTNDDEESILKEEHSD